MCTAISIGGASPLFGRTLDLECSYRERVVIAPEGYVLNIGQGGGITQHPAIIGVATVARGEPLYYDAMSSHGLAVAALNFPKSAKYTPPVSKKRNIPSYALIPLVLSECRTLAEASELLRELNITSEPFSESLPPSPLHWMISDGRESIVAEPREDGLRVYENPYGILTNEPPFPYHELHVAEFAALHPGYPERRLLGDAPAEIYCGGMGAKGLPGELSSPSRFVRAAFAARYTLSDGSEWGEVSRFFHVADTVAVPEGCVITESGKPSRTVYTSAMDLSRGVYYVRTYAGHRIYRVSLSEYHTGGTELLEFPLPEGGEAAELSPA